MSLTPERFRRELNKLSPAKGKRCWRNDVGLMKFIAARQAETSCAANLMNKMSGADTSYRVVENCRRPQCQRTPRTPRMATATVQVRLILKGSSSAQRRMARRAGDVDAPELPSCLVRLPLGSEVLKAPGHIERPFGREVTI